MHSGCTSALAIHVCADIAHAEHERRLPRLHATPDTAQRLQWICHSLGIRDQRTFAGKEATTTGLLGALTQAAEVLTDHGSLVLTFAGHSVRGDGPIGGTRWCLFDGGVELWQVASHLAQLPHDASVLVICDSCYGSAIASTLAGPQPVVVLASCGDDQTLVDRRYSEFVVKLQRFVDAHGPPGSLSELRSVLEDDTPDCERPVVWTNAGELWSRPIPRTAVRRTIAARR